MSLWNTQVKRKAFNKNSFSLKDFSIVLNIMSSHFLQNTCFLLDALTVNVIFNDDNFKKPKGC